MGPASHTNHLLRVETSGGSSLELVLRRYTDAERLGVDPWYVPANEVRAIQTLELADLPVPRLVAADVEAERCDVPTLLVTALPGALPAEPADPGAFVHALAEPLPAIHALMPHPGLPSYEPYEPLSELRPPPWSRHPDLWERAVEVLAGPAPAFEPRFIHRDYHQWNTLWVEDRLTGIVDWTTGCIGPPEIDHARMRQNLVVHLGPEAAEGFRTSVRVLGEEPHPYWDLLDAVDALGYPPGPDEEAEPEAYERFEAYVARLLAELG